jgi:hypothetical protein
MSAPFEDLLGEVCDRARYLRVEEKIRPGYAAIVRGEVVDIVTGKPVEEEAT